MTWSVYQVVHVATGLCFTGQTRDPGKAWAIQRRELCSQRHCNADLQAAWDFYRPGDFEFVVLGSGLGEAEAREAVRRLVAEARSRDLSYNIGPGVKTKARVPARRSYQRANPMPPRPVVVAGVPYESLSDAARRFGVQPSTILKRVRSPMWPDHQYAEAS